MLENALYLNSQQFSKSGKSISFKFLQFSKQLFSILFVQQGIKIYSMPDSNNAFISNFSISDSLSIVTSLKFLQHLKILRGIHFNLFVIINFLFDKCLKHFFPRLIYATSFEILANSKEEQLANIDFLRMHLSLIFA